MRFLLLMLIVVSVSAACNESIQQYVPAVVGNGGGIVGVNISTVPGNGDIYIRITPRIGISTQESIEQAVAYAYELAGKERNCDVLVEFDEYNTNFIDGPSAGTALAVMTYSLIEGKPLRDDTIITGTVDASGNIGPVGGLYEKAKGAIDVGARYFITPREQFYEMLLLGNLEDESDIIILEANNVSQVIAFMTENEPIEQEDFDSRKREIPSIGQYDVSIMHGFADVSMNTIDLEKEIVGQIDEGNDDGREMKEFFENEIRRQTGLFDQGYYYSAANEAFLNYIDLVTLNAIIENNVDLEQEREQILDCLEGIERPEITESNFEWVVGGDLRFGWAIDQIESTITDDEMLQDEKFLTYNELMYARAWCHVSTELMSAASAEGRQYDEDLWEPLARSRLDEARELSMPDGGTWQRLMIAEDSYQNGFYGAAIFDAVYVISTEEAQMERAMEIDQEALEDMMERKPESLWGEIYHSHGAYLVYMNNSAVAYDTFRFSEDLDDAVAQMAALQQPVEEEPGDSILEYLIIATAATIFLLAILLIFILRRVYGRKTGRNQKIHRNKQKKR